MMGNRGCPGAEKPTRVQILVLPYQLCDLGQVCEPLCASASLPAEQSREVLSSLLSVPGYCAGQLRK